MRYATWKILFSSNPELGGTTPEGLQGAFFTNSEQTTIAGYVPADVDVSLLADWDVQEISANEFLDLLLAVNPEAELRDGRVWVPSQKESE